MSELRLVEDNLHEVATDGRRLLFHVPTTGLFELDEAGGALLNLLRARGAGDAATLRQGFDGRLAPQDLAETLQGFLDLGIVVPGETAAPAATRPPLRIESFPLTTLVLNVTTGCNLACGYCYKEDLDSPRAARRMDLETARRGIELLLAESPDRERYNLVFFGGEPLSNLPLIRAVVDHAESRFAELGKRVDFSLTTNATLLDEGVIDWLDAHRFGLTVSIDGPPPLHDRNRCSLGGQGTYDVVADKARLLLSRYRSRPVGARVTLTAGVTDVVGIWDHLINELRFAEVGFSPVTSGEMAAFNLNGEELTTVFAGLKALGERYLTAALVGENIGFSNLHQLLTDLHEGTSKALPCGAGVGLLALDRDGGLNLCHRFTGSELPTFGSLDDGLDRAGLAAFLEARGRAEDEPACRSCRIRGLCAGGCYHESYARYGDPQHPTYHYCELMRDWVDFGIGVYARIMAANPAFLERHVLPRRAPKG